MQQLNEYPNKYQKEDKRTPFNLIWKIIFNWIKGDAGPENDNVSEPLEVYRISLNSSIDHQKENTNKPSAILKRCEGARGILYMKKNERQSFLPYSGLKRTRIIEIKDVSMKIRVHEGKVVNQLIYIENVLGFLKEVD